MSEERPNAVTMDGQPFTLAGPEIRPGDAAPDFRIQGPDFRPVTLGTLGGGARVLLSFPSLDTGVCDRAAREFVRRAGEIPGVPILAVSVDMPGALRRWCAAGDAAGRLTLGSDHFELSFGHAWGVAMPQLRQLSRAAFVVGPEGAVVHAQYVPEIGQEPDYDAVLGAAREAAGAA